MFTSFDTSTSRAHSRNNIHSVYSELWRTLSSL